MYLTAPTLPVTVCDIINKSFKELLKILSKYSWLWNYQYSRKKMAETEMSDNMAEELDYEHEGDGTEASDPVEPSDHVGEVGGKPQVGNKKPLLLERKLFWVFTV